MATSTLTRPSPPREVAPRRGLAARVSLGRVFAPVPSEFLLIASTALLLRSPTVYEPQSAVNVFKRLGGLLTSRVR